MNKLEIKNLDNEIIITLKPRGVFLSRWINLAIVLCCLLWGLLGLYNYFYDYNIIKGPSGFETFVTCVLCFYLAVQYGKKVLWNFFGKEVMHIQPQHYKVYNDFKYYQTNAFGNDFEKMEVDYITYSADEKKMKDYEVVDAEMVGRENVRGVLYFQFDNFNTQSESYLEEIDLIEAVREIRKFCKKMKIEGLKD